MSTYLYKDLPFNVQIEAASTRPLFGVRKDGLTVWSVTHSVDDQFTGGVCISSTGQLPPASELGDTMITQSNNGLELATPFGGSANKNIVVFDGVASWYLNAVSVAPT